jgi:hypothetical protein
MVYIPDCQLNKDTETASCPAYKDWYILTLNANTHSNVEQFHTADSDSNMHKFKIFFVSFLNTG